MITKKIFFDANIFNDIYDKSRKYHKQSSALFIEMIARDVSICTSCDIITNVYYITAKYTSKENALVALNYLKQSVQIIPFDNQELSQTVLLMQEDNDYNDMEDTIQYVLAKKENCDAIITNDKKFTSKNINIFSSEAFCKQYNIGY